MIALSQHCLPRDPEKINQCFAVFTVSVWFVLKEIRVNVFWERKWPKVFNFVLKEMGMYMGRDAVRI